MSGYGLVEQLTAVIKYLTDYPQGLSMLLGTVPPPSCEDINAMLETARPVAEPTLDPAGFPLRVDGGGAGSLEADRLIDNEERWNRIIESAGGWPHINAVTKEWAEDHQLKWHVLVDHVRWVKPNLWRVDGSQLDRIADKYGVCTKTVYRIANNFAQRLAMVIIKTPVNNEVVALGERVVDRVAV